MLCFVADGRFPPPWYVDVEAPACGAVLEVPAEATNDGVARRFVCDQPAGHEDREKLAAGEWSDRHRQVTDNEAGEAFTWPVGLTFDKATRPAGGGSPEPAR